MLAGMDAERAAAHVIDVTDLDFESQVLDRSKQVPVVVDFWAPWCGPCKTLGPLLERLAAEHAGGFVLAKVNIDENPQLAAAFRVQSIPMVVGLREGALAAHFVGAQPESAVREFLAKLLPSQADQLAEDGTALLAAGQTAEAEQCFQQALALNPRADAALVGLAAVHLERGEYDTALQVLERVGPGSSRQEADRLAAAIRIRQSGAGDEASLRAKIAADPTDLEARYLLGQTQAAAGRYADALENYLALVRADRSFRDDGARKAMIDVFDLLGPGDELADRYRSELAKVLFR
jgi:putative thioredoxin